MNKRKIIVLFFLCIFTFSMTGCGDKLEKLSKEQEDAIIAYSTACVGRYNKNQNKGFIRYAEEKKTADKTETETKEETSEENASKSEKDSEQKDGQNNPDNATKETGTSLNDALKVEGMNFTSEGTQVTEKYTYGDYVSLRPNSGKSYLVYKVKGTNTSQNEINVDFLSKGYKFNFTINGTEVASNDTTILLNDLSTYQATVKPGEEVELVLLFQFPSSKVANMTSQSMEMVDGDQTIKIGL